MSLHALFLCEKSLRTAGPWGEAGYICHCVDLGHPAGIIRQGNFILYGADLLTWALPAGVSFAFACGMPTCTDLASSGARWWEDKGLEALANALLLVARVEKLLRQTAAPYYLENPVGRLATCWKQPCHRFDPCDYAGYLPAVEMEGEAYTKKTCLWTGGGFVMPPMKPVFPVLGSKMHTMSNVPDRQALRSESPRGFALAVFEANAAQAVAA